MANAADQQVEAGKSLDDATRKALERYVLARGALRATMVATERACSELVNPDLKAGLRIAEELNRSIHAVSASLNALQDWVEAQACIALGHDPNSTDSVPQPPPP